MASDGPVLAFDTSAAHCAVALFSQGVCTVRVEQMTKGQAERLMPMVLELLSEQGMDLQDVARIGVGVGPGNFTGIRISVSAARGMALGLGVPAIGVTGFDALRHASGANTVAISAPRDMAYLQIAGQDPKLVAADDVPAEAQWYSTPDPLVHAIAQLARHAPADAPAPSPLYIRPADAAPPRMAPPVILPDYPSS